MKFINNLINNLTPFLFYLLGGYLVIQDQLTLGALVAALSAHKDLISPWKELLDFYNRFMDSSIRYETIIEKFDPQGLIDADRQTAILEIIPGLDGDIEITNVSLQHNNLRVLRNVSMTIKSGTSVALTGSDHEARDKLAQILSRTLRPDTGRVTVGGEALENLSDAVTGARIAYVGTDSHVFGGTVGDNVRLSLKRFPPRDFEQSDEIEAQITEALAAGNSPYPFAVEWANYRESGFNSRDEFNDWYLKLIDAVGAKDFVFERGLDAVIDTKKHPDLTSSVLQTRRLIAGKLEADPDLDALVCQFHPDQYNTYASVAENILFGEPTDQRLATVKLSNDPYLIEVLDACDLCRRFEEIGLRLANMMLEMFEDLPVDHPFYQRYNFMDESILTDLQSIQQRNTLSIENLTTEELSMLTGGVYRLIPERHRLDLIDEPMQESLLEARRYFRQHIPPRLKDAVVPFDADTYLPNTSILTNALVGRVAFSEANAERSVRQMIKSVFEEHGLRKDVELMVDEYQTGIGGSLLSTSGRELIVLIRALGKRPDIVILNRALTSFEDSQRFTILGKIRELLPQATIFWMDKALTEEFAFDQKYEITDGNVRLLEEQQTETNEVDSTDKEIQPGSELDLELDRLGHAPLFADLPRNELMLISLASRKHRVEGGEILFNQGDLTDGVYTVLDGEIEVLYSNDKNQQQILAKLGNGDMAGTLDVVCNRPRSNTVRASQSSTLLFTAAEDVTTLLTHNPSAANAMLRYLGQHLGKAIEQPVIV